VHGEADGWGPGSSTGVDLQKIDSKSKFKRNMVVIDLKKGTSFSIGTSSYSKWILN
jgi:hypothetical protein